MEVKQSGTIEEIVSQGKVPRHVAIIMDGNGRWAKNRMLPRFAGHRAGVETVRRVVSECGNLGVEVLTLFAFSSENWRRPPKEVSLLMELFMTALRQEIRKLNRNNVRLKVIGGREAFSEKLQRRILEAEEATAQNSGLTLVIAANYGGRWDVMNAACQIVKAAQAGEIDITNLTEEEFARHIALHEFPEPDLFIRTGGEHRISNFLLWQLAYTELYFTSVLWPDFSTDEFHKSVFSYASRQRRFGQTGEQVEKVAGA